MSIILSHSEVLLGQNHSVWDSMMLILAAMEILYWSFKLVLGGGYLCNKGVNIIYYGAAHREEYKFQCK